MEWLAFAYVFWSRPYGEGLSMSMGLSMFYAALRGDLERKFDFDLILTSDGPVLFFLCVNAY